MRTTIDAQVKALEVELKKKNKGPPKSGPSKFTAAPTTRASRMQSPDAERMGARDRRIKELTSENEALACENSAKQRALSSVVGELADYRHSERLLRDKASALESELKKAIGDNDVLKSSKDELEGNLCESTGSTRRELEIALQDARDIIKVEEDYEEQLGEKDAKLAAERKTNRALAAKVKRLGSISNVQAMCDIPPLHEPSGRHSNPAKRLYLQLLYSGIPPSAVTPAVAAFMGYSNTSIGGPMPATDFYTKLKWALLPLNTLLCAILVAVCTTFVLFMDGKIIRGFEVLALTFKASLLGNKKATFTSGGLVVENGTAIGGVETVTCFFDRMRELLALLSESLRRNGHDTNNPGTWWRHGFENRGVPSCDEVDERKTTVVGSDSCNTMKAQVKEFFNVVEEKMPRPQEEQQPSITSRLRIGCHEHYSDNNVKLAIRALDQKLIDIFQGYSSEPLTHHQKLLASPVYHLRQLHLLMSSGIPHHLNLWSREIKGNIKKLHENEVWLSYPRGVGQRFWAITKGAIVACWNRPQAMNVLSVEVHGKPTNKLERGVDWQLQSDVLYAALKAIAIFADQLICVLLYVYSCSSTTKEQVVPMRLMAEFHEKVEEVLILGAEDPSQFLTNARVLWSFTPKLKEADEAKQNQLHPLNKNIGTRTKEGRAPINTASVLYSYNSTEDELVGTFIECMCAAFVGGFRETNGMWLKSQNGSLSGDNPIPQQVEEAGLSNIISERVLSLATNENKKTVNALEETIAGSTAAKFNEFMDPPYPRPTKAEKAHNEKKDENAGIGLCDQLQPHVVKCALDIAIAQRFEEHANGDQKRNSQISHQKAKCADTIKHAAEAIIKKAVDRAGAAVDIAEGGLFKTEAALDEMTKEIEEKYTRGNPLNKIHTTCHGQIQLFSDGLNYDEARQIPFTKGGKKLDLVEPLRKLIRIGIERNFVPVEDASHDELEEGEAELPGPTATFVLEKRRARKEFTAKARETATMKVAELRKKRRDEEMEKAVAKQKKKDDAERRKKDAAQKKAKRSKPKKQLGSSSQKQK